MVGYVIIGVALSVCRLETDIFGTDTKRYEIGAAENTIETE